MRKADGLRDRKRRGAEEEEEVVEEQGGRNCGMCDE